MKASTTVMLSLKILYQVLQKVKNLYFYSGTCSQVLINYESTKHLVLVKAYQKVPCTYLILKYILPVQLWTVTTKTVTFSSIYYVF